MSEQAMRYEEKKNIADETFLRREPPGLFSLRGKTAVVTGGRNGNLGPIWVETLSEAGAHVVVLDLPECDVTEGWIVPYRKIDILVNNAGIDIPPGPEMIENRSAEFFGRFFDILKVNLIGSARMVEQVLISMIQNGGGVIVNIGSVMGSVGADPSIYPDGFEKPAAYGCSKAALAQLSRAITTQYGRFNIRAVTLSFAGVDSPGWSPEFRSKYMARIPLGRPVSKQSLQTALLFACCCPELAGEEVLIDGGYCAQ